jgi:hypothetical protein
MVLGGIDPNNDSGIQKSSHIVMPTYCDTHPVSKYDRYYNFHLYENCTISVVGSLIPCIVR